MLRLFSLAGETALITGGGSGLGLARCFAGHAESQTRQHPLHSIHGNQTVRQPGEMETRPLLAESVNPCPSVVAIQSFRLS
jgi:hypothetical protein